MIKNQLRTMVQISTFLITPIMIGIAVTSEEFVCICLSSKWLGAIPFMIVFSIGYIFLPISSSCNVAIKAIGRADVFAKNQTIRILAMFGILLVSVFSFHNAFAIAIGYSISLFIEMLIAVYPVNKYIGYRWKELFSDVIENLAPATIMGIVAYFVSVTKMPYIIRAITKVIVGIGVYLGLAILLKNRSMIGLKNILQNFTRNKKNGGM